MRGLLQAVSEAAQAGKGGVEAALGLASTQALLQIKRCLHPPAGQQPAPAAVVADLHRKLNLMLAQTD